MTGRLETQKLLTETYLAIERATGRGSVEQARKMVRAIGLRFSNAEASIWLSPFILGSEKRARTARRTEKRPPSGRRDGRGFTRETDGKTDGTRGRQNGLTRDKVYSKHDQEVTITPDSAYAESGGSTALTTQAPPATPSSARPQADSGSASRAPESSTAAAAPKRGSRKRAPQQVALLAEMPEAAPASRDDTPGAIVAYAYDLALEYGLREAGVPEAAAKLRDAVIAREVPIAKRLIETYGAERVREKAERLVELFADGSRTNGPPGMRKLAYAWDDADLTDPPRAKGFSAEDAAAYAAWYTVNGHRYEQERAPIDTRVVPEATTEMKDAFDQLLRARGVAS